MYTVGVSLGQRNRFGQSTFRISVCNAGEVPWTVDRRFSEFVQLRAALCCQHVLVPALSDRNFLSYILSDSFHAKRARNLQMFLTHVVEELEPNPRTVALRAFLNINEPFMHRVNSFLSHSNDAGLQFPEDVLVNVFSYLEALEVIRLAAVARRWRIASRSPQLWESITVATSQFERVQNCILLFLESLGPDNRLRDLSLSVCGLLLSGTELAIVHARKCATANARDLDAGN